MANDGKFLNSEQAKAEQKAEDVAMVNQLRMQVGVMQNEIAQYAVDVANLRLKIRFLSAEIEQLKAEQVSGE